MSPKRPLLAVGFDVNVQSKNYTWWVCEDDKITLRLIFFYSDAFIRIELFMLLHRAILLWKFLFDSVFFSLFLWLALTQLIPWLLPHSKHFGRLFYSAEAATRNRWKQTSHFHWLQWQVLQVKVCGEQRNVTTRRLPWGSNSKDSLKLKPGTHLRLPATLIAPGLRSFTTEVQLPRKQTDRPFLEKITKTSDSLRRVRLSFDA